MPVKPLAMFKGKVVNNKFFFPLSVNRTIVRDVVLDTGAAELAFSKRVAELLRLPRLGTVEVRGVSGTTSAYRSKCNLRVGNRTFINVPCIVIPQLPYSALFGLRFFIDNQLKLSLNPISQTMTILAIPVKLRKLG